ncbi:Hypothetical protein A7982_09180 [Minicystis rosea]|nr:Hypothetical protein A7982_09180 [Minicystis rosea]
MRDRMAAPIDREALLVALVLSPATYSRNRFFELYKDPEVRRIRRRAAQVRSIVRQVTSGRAARGALGEGVNVAAVGGRIELSYEVPAMGLRRTVLLDPLEMALIRFAMARASGLPLLPPDDPDRMRVEDALARLAPQGTASASPG